MLVKKESEKSALSLSRNQYRGGSNQRQNTRYPQNEQRRLISRENLQQKEKEFRCYHCNGIGHKFAKKLQTERNQKKPSPSQRYIHWRKKERKGANHVEFSFAVEKDEREVI